MARYNVYRNPSKASAGRIPFLLDLQSDLLSYLNTRVVAPLVKARAFGAPAKRLNPVMTVNGVTVVLSPAQIAAAPTKVLGAPVANLAGHSNEIIAALDLLFTGY